jgi:hypothetical protein
MVSYLRGSHQTRLFSYRHKPLSHESQSGDKSGGEKRAPQYIRVTSPKAVKDAQSAASNDLIYGS